MISRNLEDKTINQMQPLVLAMIGDSVQTLFVRTEVALRYGVKVNKMNKLVSSVVQAGSQFKTFKKIEETLTEQEADIARRARNTHIHTKAKNFSYAFGNTTNLINEKEIDCSRFLSLNINYFGRIINV